MKKLINWKLYFVLLAACTVVSAMVLPYTLALSPAVAAAFTPALFFVQIASNLVTYGVITFLGLFFAKRTGMGAPIVEGALAGENQGRRLKFILLPSIGLGVLVFVLILVLSIPFQGLSVSMLKAEINVAWWQGLLASFYGGIAEEVFFRLFVVSVLAWLTARIKRTPEGLPTKTGMWIAIILSSVVFGLGHLGITGSLTAITGAVVLRAVLLNGAAGVICGWLYWRKGLESAIIAHFTADVFLHVITPLVASLFLT